MKDHPILFNSDMVRAILEGQKTETRRIIKPQPNYNLRYGQNHKDLEENILRRCPYGQVGDQLWVRETWAEMEMSNGNPYAYRATGDIIGCWHWKPSIFMPKIASRITLEIIEISVERVQDITRENIRNEGVSLPPSPRFDNSEFSELHQEFRFLWDLINKKRGYSWESNPWIWVIKFKRCNL